jgi:hypothetical protein
VPLSIQIAFLRLGHKSNAPHLPVVLQTQNLWVNCLVLLQNSLTFGHQWKISVSVIFGPALAKCNIFEVCQFRFVKHAKPFLVLAIPANVKVTMYARKYPSYGLD